MQEIDVPENQPGMKLFLFIGISIKIGFLCLLTAYCRWQNEMADVDRYAKETIEE